MLRASGANIKHRSKGLFPCVKSRGHKLGISSLSSSIKAAFQTKGYSAEGKQEDQNHSTVALNDPIKI